MPRRPHYPSVPVLLLGLHALGCGELLNGDSSAQPLASINALLVGEPSAVIQEDVALSLVWEAAPGLLRLDCADDACVSPPYSTAFQQYFPPSEARFDFDMACDGEPWQGTLELFDERARLEHLESRLEYEPVFPISFTMRLFQPPRTEALYDLSSQGGSGVFASGRVIAYVDENGNQRFDYGTPQRAPERGLALSANGSWLRSRFPESRTGFTVLFKSGEINLERVSPAVRDLLAAVPEGYSVLVEREGADAEIVPLTEDVSFELRVDPEVAGDTDWCEESERSIRYAPETDAGEPVCLLLIRDEDGLRAASTMALGASERGSCTVQLSQAWRCLDFSNLSEPPIDWPSLFPDAWSCGEKVVLDLRDS